MSNKTQLYRHYDCDGTLLYIGISLCTIRRLGQHRSNSPWFESIRRIEVEHFPTFEDAQLAERKAIKAERPRFNCQHSKDTQPIPAIDIRAARAVLGQMWGLDRPLYASELARALRLRGRDPGATVIAWESKGTPISGPVSVAVEMMLSGAKPPTLKEAIL